MVKGLKEETLEQIKEVNEKIKNSDNGIERMMIRNKELNPLLLLWAELSLQELKIL